MSRLFIACSLIAALSTSAIADRAIEPSFSKPPARVTKDIAFAPRHIRVLDRDVVRGKLVAARVANLARFRAYQQKGVFPNNTYADGKLNVWLDEDGHLCAAATIIHASGQADLVARIADDDNFIKLADVTSGPLMDWILTSGFLQGEIVAIQEPFQPVMIEPSPQPIVAVDARKRRAEDQRLAAKYRQVDAMLVKNQTASIELAVDRLMARPALAWKLVGI